MSIFYWQRLLHQRCPVSDHQIVMKRAGNGMVFYNCVDDKCGFGISDAHVFNIFSDPNHSVHKYLTREESNMLAIAMCGKMPVTKPRAKIEDLRSVDEEIDALVVDMPI